MKKLLILLGVVTVALVLFSGAVSAASPVKRVSTVISDQNNPSLDGSIVVWSDQRHGNSDIYMKDLNGNNPEKVVYVGAGDQTNPDKSGKYVVWQNRATIPYKIYYKDLTSPSGPRAVCASSNDQYSPRISGNTVVFTEEIVYGAGDGYSSFQIVSYDLVTHHKSILGLGDSADVYKNKVAFFKPNSVLYYGMFWYDDLGGSITLHNLADGTSRHILELSNAEHTLISNVKVYGDRVLYLEDVYPFGDYTLKCYNISTGLTTTLSSKAKNPDILANFVVWEEKNPSNKYDVVMTDIAGSHPLSLVSAGVANSNSPTISGYVKAGVYVVWKGSFGGKSVLFWRNMDPNPPWIKATYPRHGQTGFSRTGLIIIKFNKYISPSTNYAGIKIKNLSTNHYINLSKSIKNDVLYLKPKNTLYSQTRYQIIIPSKSVKDNAYNYLATTKTIIFRTRT